MSSEVKINLIVNDDGTVVLKNFGDNAAANFKKVEDSSASMGSSFVNTWQGMTVVLNQGLQLFQQIASYAEEPIKAYMESEQALLKMGMAMKNQGDFSRAALADMEEYASHIQKITAYEDDAALAIMGNLKTYGLSNEQVKEATKAALDLATAKANEGMSVEKASEIIGKSYLGIQTGLKKIGIQIDETAPKGELFNNVMLQIEKRFGGSAQAELITYAGQWKHLKNQWQDVQEFMGLTFLRTIQAVQASMSALNVITQGVVAGILTGIGWLAEKLAEFAKFAGLDGVSSGLSTVSQSMKIMASVAEDAAVKSAKNFEMLEKSIKTDPIDKVSQAIDKMGKQGQRTKPILDDVTKGMAKSALEVVKSQEAAAKSLFEMQIKGAEAAAKAAQDVGQNELITIQNKFKAETDAAYDYYSKMYDLAWEKVQTEKKTAKAGYDEIAVFNAAIDKLDIDYDKSYQEKLDARNQTIRDYAKKNLETEASLYRALPEYSNAAAAADIANLNKRYIELQRFTTNSVLLEQVKAEEIRKIELKKAEYSDSFLEGVKAGLKDLEKQQTHWGKVGIDSVKSFSKNAESTLSNVFFDAYKKDLKSAGEYFTAFTDSMAKEFFNTLAKMATEAVIKKITMSFNAEWTSGASSVLSAIGKILGYTSDWFFGDSNGTNGGENIPTYGDNGTINLAYGGWVPGYAAYAGNSYMNDKVRALLSPEEYVVDREMIQAIAAQGQRGDTMLAHINPAEAALLKALGGAGTVNQRTGLLQFYENPDTDYLQMAADYLNQVHNSGGNLASALHMMTLAGFNIQPIGDSPYASAYSLPQYQAWANNFSFGVTGGRHVTGETTDTEGKYDIRLFYNSPIQDTGGSGGIGGLLGNILSISTGGMTDMLGWTQSEQYAQILTAMIDPLASSLVQGNGIFIQSEGKDIARAADRQVDPGGVIDKAFREIGDELPYSFREVAPELFTTIGAIVGSYIPVLGNAAGAAIGSGIGSKLQAGTDYYDYEGDAIRAGVTYGTVYATDVAGDYVSGALGSQVAGKLAGMVAGKLVSYGLSEALASYVSDSINYNINSKSLKTSLTSITDNGLLSSLYGSMQSMERPRYFDFSAREGLAYVPRDNYLVNTHKGERILTPEENEEYTNGNKLVDDLLSEMRDFRSDMKVIGYALAKNTQKMTRILEQFNNDGMPPERVYS